MVADLSIGSSPSVGGFCGGWSFCSGSGVHFPVRLSSDSVSVGGLSVNSVGMSTIPEVIMASRLNVDLLVLSLMSNYAVGLTTDDLTHEKVLENSIKYNKHHLLNLK